jgi:hypothetical protein
VTVGDGLALLAQSVELLAAVVAVVGFLFWMKLEWPSGDE